MEQQPASAYSPASLHPGASMQRRAFALLAAGLFLAVSVPSTLGSIIFFTLALTGATVPILSTIITTVAPAAHRGAVLGIVVAVSTLPGIIAPLVTGLIIQAAGKNVAFGFRTAYLLTSLLLLIVGGVFLAFARPDDEQQEEKEGVVHLHS